MVAFIPVVALIQAVVVNAVEVGVAGGLIPLNPAAVHNRHHISGHIGVLTAGTGDHDQSSIGELLGAAHQLIGVSVHVRLGQSPILCPHAHAGTLGLVGLVEVHQILVHIQAGILQAGDQIGHFVLIVQSAGTNAAVNGSGGSPAEYVQVGAAGQGQSAVVLQQGNTLTNQLGVDLIGLRHAFLGDGPAAHGQVDHGEHGTKADQVSSNDQGQQDSQTSLAADHGLFGLGQLHAGDHNQNRQHQNDAKANQLRFH